MRRNILGRTAAVGVLAICTGCTSSGARSLDSFSNQLLTGGSGTTAPAATDGYGQMPAQPAPAASGMFASFRQAGNSFAGAMKIESKVTPPVDPIKLDNAPADSNQVAADLHCHAGYFFETQKKYAEASSHYRDAMTKAPRDARALAGYGRVQDQLGNRIEADQYLMKACEVAPQDPGPRGDLAQSCARRGDLQSALVHQQRAVELQPGNQAQRIQLARILVAAGRADEAVQQLIPSHGSANAQTIVGQLIAGVPAAVVEHQSAVRPASFQPAVPSHGAACSCSAHRASGVTRLPATPY